MGMSFIQFAPGVANIFKYIRLEIKKSKLRQDATPLMAALEELKMAEEGAVAEIKGYKAIKRKVKKLNLKHHRDLQDAHVFAMKGIFSYFVISMFLWGGYALHDLVNLKRKEDKKSDKE